MQKNKFNFLVLGVQAGDSCRMTLLNIDRKVLFCHMVQRCVEICMLLCISRTDRNGRDGSGLIISADDENIKD